MIGDRYTLERELGRGGMGAVWLASDRLLGREVAIKRVGVAPGGESPEVERVRREARIAARISHPNLVAVYDLVEHDGEHWLVMEHVAGMTLSDLVFEHGRLSADQGAPLLAGAAAGLAAAHEIGVVHRDVKPSNILVGTDGVAKLSDFGIARAQTDAALTSTGLVTGSPSYLAPEVASGQAASTASDVWSFGATAYHALTGHPPYEVGDNVIGTLYQIVNEEPPRLDRGLWLEPFVTAAMTIDPARRWTMGDVLAFLQSSGQRMPERTLVSVPTMTIPGSTPPQPTQLLTTAQVAPPPAVPKHAAPNESRKRGSWWTLVALVAVLIALLLIGRALITSDDEPTPSASSPSEEATQEPAESKSAEPEEPEKPTRQELAAFPSSYLSRADASPRQAWQMLTPEFQAESGGLDGYLDWWGGISNVRNIEVEDVDVKGMTVTYSYTFDLAGRGRQDDTVRLTLVQPEPGGDLLIAGEG